MNLQKTRSAGMVGSFELYRRDDLSVRPSYTLGAKRTQYGKRFRLQLVLRIQLPSLRRLYLDEVLYPFCIRILFALSLIIFATWSLFWNSCRAFLLS